VTEAVAADVTLDAVFAEPGADPALLAALRSAGVEVVDVAEGALRKVLDVVNPQPVVAVAHQIQAQLGSVVRAARERRAPVLGLVGLQDPGNAGTLVRVAEAAGCAGVVFSSGSVDVWNPKVVRASAGSILRVPVVEGVEPTDLVAAGHGASLTVVATTAGAGTAPEDLDLAGPALLLVGSEAHGLPRSLVDAADQRVTIPMQGEVESLNAAVAGSLLAFEAARQRRAGTDFRSGPADGPE